jgi:NAD(P)-dependent dehydrogenase (short-subunit alcohol dehydrogenase family)
VIQALSHISQGKEVTFIHAGTAASYFASPGQSAYTASKAACNMLLDQLHAGELSP